MISLGGAQLVAAQTNTKLLRRELAPSSVMAFYGCKPHYVGARRLNYVNPFRVDNKPSLDIFRNRDNGEWRVGDMAEDFQGSSIDLILRFNPDWNTNDAIEFARALYAHQLVYGEPFVMTDSVAQDFHWPNPRHDSVTAEMWHYYYSKTHPALPPVGFLRQHFGVVIMPNEVVYAPYYNVDDEIIGYKMLSRKHGKRNGTGSKPALYGTRSALRRLSDTVQPVILCEGESDCWVMEHGYGDEYVVISFPGANQNIQDILGGYDRSTWDGRQAIVCFDGDAAGTSGRQQVAGYLKSMGAMVSVVPMPEGRDVGVLTPQDISDLFSEWQLPYDEQQKVLQVGASYRRLAADGSSGAEIANWALEIDRFLIGEDNETYAFEGRLLPNNRKVTLTSADFRSVQKIIDWSQSHARNFFGSTADAQKLGSYLLNQATFAPVGRITTRVGLHRGDFVWAGGHIGDDAWHYVPRPTGLSLRSEQTWVKQRTDHQSLDTLKRLTEMHEHEIVMPMLSWLAAAPLRPLFKQFPILHLSGTSGSGKTTLTQVLMTMFSGSQITSNLTTTTPFAISAHFMASNGFPIWFDEYRPGARDDAKKALDQLLRDTYTGQVSTKGAMNANRAEVMEILTDTPVIVTGEDTLSEKSHVDRCIILNLPMKGKREDTLASFDFETPLTHNYLSWLHKNYMTDEITLPESDLDVNLALTNRQRLNFRVLQYGYNLLRSYAEHLTDSVGDDWQLPPRSWDMTIRDAIIASDENPIIELIRWAYENNHDAVIVLGGGLDIAISTVELMRLQNNHNGPGLPIPFEKHTALGRWLEDNFGASKRNITHNGRNKKMYVAPIGHIVEEVP